MSDATVENLFIVSTLGQIENALRVIKMFEVPQPHFLYLFTKMNMTMADRLNARLQDCAYSFEALELPPEPALRLPWRINRIVRSYDALYERFKQADLWIANINNHYRYLAFLFAQFEGRVNYFEEGLSTYLLASDPRFKPPGHVTFRKTLSAVSLSFRARHIRFKRRLLRALRHIYVYFNQGFFGRTLSMWLTKGQSHHFTGYWTQFDQVIVAYPKLLDPALFRAQTVLELPPAPVNGSAYVEPSELQPQTRTTLTRPSDAIFISQLYGVPVSQWGALLADLFVGNGFERIFVKFHPREKLETRKAFIEALEVGGITVRESVELDQYPVEKIVQLLDVKDCLGITSTALLQIPRCHPSVQMHSLAKPILTALKTAQTLTPQALETLTLDTQLIERVAQAAEIKVKFWK